MFMKQPKPRGFDYFPYYYRESQLEDEDERPHIRFRRLTNRPPGKRRSTIVLAILAVAVLVLWQYFGELVKKDPKATTTGPFQVEEVIVVE